MPPKLRENVKTDSVIMMNLNAQARPLQVRPLTMTVLVTRVLLGVWIILQSFQIQLLGKNCYSSSVLRVQLD